MYPSSTSTRSVRGVTLLELMLASSLGAVLLIATTHMAQLFTQQVEHLREEADDDLETACEGIAASIRNAWCVSQPATDTVEVEDANGDVTTYAVVGTELIVTRPSGAEGVLLGDVSACTVGTETSTRYREAATTDVYDAWWTTAGAGSTTATMLDHDETIAIGFVPPLSAPSSVEHVAGVEEERVGVTLEDITLTLDVIDFTDHIFWHLFPKGSRPNGASTPGDITVTLYEARGPGSAIPDGSALAQTTIDFTSLPTNAYYWQDSVTGAIVEPQPQGAGYGWWFNKNPNVGLVVSVPSAPITVPIGGLGVELEPGRAYTIVIEPGEWNAVALELTTAASGVDSVAYSSSGGVGALADTTVGVPFTLEGTSTYTQTAEYTVVQSLSLTIDLADGSTHTSSAAVTGQVAVSDPWLGAVPGDLPTLEIQ